MIQQKQITEMESKPRAPLQHCVREVLTGSLIYNLILTGLALIFYRNFSVFLGLFVGMISTGMMLLHIAYSMESVMELEQAAEAEKKMLKSVYLRKGLFIFFYLAVLLWFTEWVNPLAVLAGAFGMKAGVYLRPFIKKAGSEFLS